LSKDLERTTWDAVIIGGGFYGCIIAIYLAKERWLKNILILEKESALLTRSSYNNQARVHNGYHYPRSFITAYRSRINFPKFIKDWPDASVRNFTKLYAIANYNSKVTKKQFVRFCQEIGAKLAPAPPKLHALFNKRLIAEVFEVEECAFDASILAKWAAKELDECRVTISYSCCALSIEKNGIVKKDPHQLKIYYKDYNNGSRQVTAKYVFNCAYSGLNQLKGEFPGLRSPLKHEIAELSLAKMPPQLEKVGVTVMDGAFFSMMPFPPRSAHTVSHVRYTPHTSWNDQRDINPYSKLDNYDKSTRYDRMIRDISRYLPIIKQASYVDSLFEVKTVLMKNEGNDGRPILFEQYPELPGLFSILGSKIDNVYDVIEKISAELPCGVPS
jgi:glycine/D-amino acid oxidase-like deaminating enzyme